MNKLTITALITAAMFSSLAADAETIEVHTPKGAKEAYALEGVASGCKEYAGDNFTFEQASEMAALDSHYTEKRKSMGLERDFDKRRAAVREVYGLKDTDFIHVTYEQCAKILKVGK